MEPVSIYYTTDLRLVKPRFKSATQNRAGVIAGILEEELNDYVDNIGKRDGPVYLKLLETFALRSDKPSCELSVDEDTIYRRGGRLRVGVLEASLSLFSRTEYNSDFLLNYENSDSVFNRVVRLLLGCSVKKYTKNGRFFGGKFERVKISHFFEHFIDNLNLLSNREIGWSYRINVGANLLPFKQRVDGVRETSDDCRMRVNPMGLWPFLRKLAVYELNGKASLKMVLSDIVAKDMVSKLMRQKGSINLEATVSELDSGDLPNSLVEDDEEQ